MKKITLYIFFAFTLIIIFFGVFGSAIRQSLYIPVTTTKLMEHWGEDTMQLVRVVPSEAVHTDFYGKIYVWVLSESDDIVEKYFYADKTFIEISYQDDLYTGLIGIQDETVVIVTSASELQDKTRVKINRKGDK